jgi:hypothetical protein
MLIRLLICAILSVSFLTILANDNNIVHVLAQTNTIGNATNTNTTGENITTARVPTSPGGIPPGG